MREAVARAAAAVVSVVALAIGVLGLVDSWPRWVWIGQGVVGLIAITVQFVWERRSGGDGQPPTVNQTQVGGVGSTNFQAGRDITYTKGSGKGGE